MRRALLSLLAGLALVGPGTAVALAGGSGAAPVTGGDVVSACYTGASSQVDDPGYQACRSAQAGTWIAAAQCRAVERSAPGADARPDRCGEADGRDIGAAQVAAYERSWVHRALTLQRELDTDVPLWEAQIPHTHNSFNSSAYAVPTDGSAPSYYPTLTNQDPNQVYSLTDQLRMDVRFLEIDVHWVPSPYGTAATHGFWVTMCHGDTEPAPAGGVEVPVGCSDDRPFDDGLAELRRWVVGHPHDVVFVYLENQLYGEPLASAEQAHQVASRIIDRQLGDLVYRPAATGAAAGACTPLPYGESERDVLQAGGHVVLIGNCGPGGWNDRVFSRGAAWDESGKASAYDGAACRADMAARAAHASFRRYYEESPWLEAMTGGTDRIDAATTARMVGCGVNIIGFDQLQPFDGRLAALVWSWAPGEPAASGDCAYQDADGRFRAGGCHGAVHVACADPAGGWHVTARPRPLARAAAECAAEFPGSTFSVPANGFRDRQLVAARPAGVDRVYLDYARAGDTWRPGAVG